MEFEYASMEATEETRFWELPTGSRLAFAVTPASESSRRPPVVWLHGGPGAPDRIGPAPDDSVLAADGFDVYRYHQVGAGLSSRLEDVSEYTVERHVADLEAVRIEIGAERLILIGGSWGATLAAHYLAAHRSPNACAKGSITRFQSKPFMRNPAVALWAILLGGVIATSAVAQAPLSPLSTADPAARLLGGLLQPIVAGDADAAAEYLRRHTSADADMTQLSAGLESLVFGVWADARTIRRKSTAPRA